MRNLVFSATIIVAFLANCNSCYSQGAKTIQTIVKVLTGAGAAESLRRSGVSYEEYKHEDTILTELLGQGIEANRSSIFSVYFQTNGGYWADFWSKPDLFFIVDIEGQGSKLVPQIHYNYVGEPVLDVIVSESVRKGTRIVVRIFDDDSSSDLIWNGILKTRANLSVTPVVQATQFISVSGNASGQIALLDRNTTIDAPDFVASAEFIVPETRDGLWVADAKLIDEAQTEVGSLKFASLWSAPQWLDEQKSKVSSSFSKFLFWGVIGICALGWFLWNLVSNTESLPTDSNST